MKIKIFTFLTATVALFATLGLTACEHRHVYKETVVEPTCNNHGYTLYECECGYRYPDGIIKAKGHNDVDGVCTNCGGTDPIVITDDGLKYTLNDDCDSYTVEAVDTVQGNIVVPATIKNKRVTDIAQSAFSAFYNYSDLTGITIPDSVTRIGSYAFSGCTNLTSINIPHSVIVIDRGVFNYCSGLETITVDENNAYYKSVNNCILKDDGKTLVLGCKNSVIPDSVTRIMSNAFAGCTGLMSITIPNSVTEIDRSAFRGCSELKDINYNGTKEQWKAISRNINYDIDNYTVHCIDGDLSITV